MPYFSIGPSGKQVRKFFCLVTLNCRPFEAVLSSALLDLRRRFSLLRFRERDRLLLDFVGGLRPLDLELKVQENLRFRVFGVLLS